MSFIDLGINRGTLCVERGELRDQKTRPLCTYNIVVRNEVVKKFISLVAETYAR